MSKWQRAAFLGVGAVALAVWIMAAGGASAHCPGGTCTASGTVAAQMGPQEGTGHKHEGTSHKHEGTAHKEEKKHHEHKAGEKHECPDCKGECKGMCQAKELTAEDKAAAEKVEKAGGKLLTASALSARVRSGRPPILIDTLSAESYRQSHIKGAISMPAAKIKEIAPLVLPDKSAEIAVYCGGYQCGASLEAVKALKELGYENVYDFKGGLSVWRAHDMPMEGEKVKEEK